MHSFSLALEEIVWANPTPHVWGAMLRWLIGTTIHNPNVTGMKKNISGGSCDENPLSISESCITLRVIPNIWSSSLCNFPECAIVGLQFCVVYPFRELQSA